MADRESILRWLNEKAYRYVYPKDPPYRIVERLIFEGRAVRLGGSARVAITCAGVSSLARASQPESVAPEGKS